MISTGKVFIIDYKLLYDLTNVKDYTERNTTDKREMRESRSPLCVFVSANGLKPVAIQTDLTSGINLGKYLRLLSRNILGSSPPPAI